MSKRSTDVEVATTPAALSQNINLFQSLRVLQEGENGEDASALSNSEFQNTTYSFEISQFFPRLTTAVAKCHYTVIMPFRPISILYSGSFRCIFLSFRSISVKQLLKFPMFLRTGTTGYYTDNSQNSVCVRSGLLAGLLALASTVLCFLSLALTVMCYRAKRLVKGCGGDDPAHHVITGAPARCFLTHKGRIN